jgi:hypothetical protein
MGRHNARARLHLARRTLRRIVSDPTRAARLNPSEWGQSHKPKLSGLGDSIPDPIHG